MIAEALRQLLLDRGATRIGYGDLSEIDPVARQTLPIGVCVAVRYPREVIRGIADGPTHAYFAQYNALNEQLDALVTAGAAFLQEQGYQAIAQTRQMVDTHATEYTSVLPHKTVATRAGIGWIGKCALLITEQYGSMVRLSSILTDAPLPAAIPINASYCGSCSACVQACPGGAVCGENWSVAMPREQFFDAAVCKKPRVNSRCAI